MVIEATSRADHGLIIYLEHSGINPAVGYRIGYRKMGFRLDLSDFGLTTSRPAT